MRRQIEGGRVAGTKGLSEKGRPRDQDESMNAPTPTLGGPVLGLVAIGKLFDRSRFTIARWIADYDFPAAQLPNGQWATTHTLIDEWLLSRMED